MNRAGQASAASRAAAPDAAPDAADERAASETARQRAYSTSHLTDDRALQMLGRLFEPGLASRFLREVLFPVEGLP
jgi:hypothetical protein